MSRTYLMQANAQQVPEEVDVPGQPGQPGHDTPADRDRPDVTRRGPEIEDPPSQPQPGEIRDPGKSPPQQA